MTRSWRRFGMAVAALSILPVVVAVSSPAAVAAVGTVTAQNHGPYAVAQNSSMSQPSATLEIGATDTDPNPSVTCCNSSLATGPANGSVVVNLDGSFTYTPTAGFSGPDSFTYTLTDSDGNTSAPATVSLQVLANCNGNAWSVTGGTTPPPVQSKEGFYIGENNNKWTLYTAHPGTQDVVFTGTLKLGPNLPNGSIRFSGVTPHRNEDNPKDHDTITILGQETLSFHFDTFKSVDGLGFSPSCASSIKFDLQINGSEAATTTIFLGAAKSHPATNPFTLTR